MTEYTSGTQARDGRTVNHDPEPWRHYTGTRMSPDTYGPSGVRGREMAYLPRPEYAVLDNPILASIRRNDLSIDIAATSQWLYSLLNSPDGENFARRAWSANPDQLIHAHRVLSKLAALTDTTTKEDHKK